ncbi:MAG: type II secretion system protein [Desulfamplus sp.]|nr:type II secretion system protein [Desulfamplus sp.]MBF0413893.1 type II secretion system protein [Desulfamplus sp.]
MSGNHGFSYPAVLALIIITGIAAATAQRSWTTVVKREKETELLFRGDQIQRAIASYYKAVENKKLYPGSLNELIKDPRFPSTKRHLRKIYTDPMTGNSEWGVVYTQGGRIKGVFSKSSEEPIKKSNFLPQYSRFQDKTHYYDWKFIYQPDQQ